MQMILLTGATGFLGSGVLRRLIADGWDVCCIKRKTSDLYRVEGIMGECKWYNLEAGVIEQIFRDNPIQMVIHCATNYGREDTEYFNVYQTNVILPLELLEYAIKYGCRVFINTDTFFVKGIRCLWEERGKPYRSVYTTTKYLFTHIVKEQIAKWDVAFLNLQLEHLYGAGDGEHKFANFVLGQLQRNVDEIELTEGTQVRDWIYIEDALEAYGIVVSQAEHFAKGALHQIEVGTGEGRSVREFVETAKRVVGSSTKLLFGKKKMHQGELLYSCADTHILKSIGWVPQYGIEEGLRKTIEL